MRFLLLIFFLLLAPYFGSAQTTLGVKAQIGNAWISVPEGWVGLAYDDRIPHWGYSLELFKQLNQHLAIGVAPGYMRRGTAFEVGFINGFGPRYRAQLYLNYVQLPFYLKAKMKLLGRLSGYLQSGVGLAYLTSGYRQIETFNISNPPPLEERSLDFEERDDSLNRWDFGWHSSAGFTFQLGPGSILVSADYCHGLRPVNPLRSSANRNWAMGAGYQFILGENKN